MTTVQGQQAGAQDFTRSTVSIQGTTVDAGGRGPQGPGGLSAVFYDLPFFFEGKYTGGEVLYAVPFGRSATWPASAPGSRASCLDESTADEIAVVQIQRKRTSGGNTVTSTIGQVTYTPGSDAGVFTVPTDIDWLPDDMLIVVAPVTADATLGNISLLLEMTIVAASGDDTGGVTGGQPGPAGPPGENGTNGTDGTNGTNGTDGAPGRSGTNPALINFKISNTPVLTALIAAGLTSYEHFQVNIFGDSYPAGYMAINGQALVGARPFAWPAAFAAQLRAMGCNAKADWAVGDAGCTTLGYGDSIDNVLAYDARLSVTGTTKLLAGFNGLGGSMWWLQNVGDTLTFTPDNAFNEVSLIDADSTVDVGEGTFAVSFDGGATHAFTQDHNTILGPKKYTFAAPEGTLAVTLISISGNTFMSAIGTRDNTRGGIDVINTGIAGGELAVIAQAPTTAGDGATWNTMATLPQLLGAESKHISGINGWFNDRNAGRPIGDVQDSLMELIQALKPYGDVIYFTYAPLSTDVIDQETYDQWTDAMLVTCAAQDIPVIDLRQVLAPYDVMNAVGTMGDPIHMNKMGQVLPAMLLLEAAKLARTA